MNLPFLGSRIAPITSSERRPVHSKTSLTNSPADGQKIKPSKRLTQNLVEGGISSTPDSVTMYPAHPELKSLERTVSNPTKSIPIIKNLKRTASELQLMEDEAVADFRDYCMYTRIVSGITGSRRHPADLKAINNIVRTRNLPVQESSSSYAEQNSRYSMIPAGMVPPLESACRITDDYMEDLTLEDDHTLPEDEGVFIMDL